jgi:hypothetical protein
MRTAIQKDIEDDDDAVEKDAEEVAACEHCGSTGHVTKDCAVMKAAAKATAINFDEEDDDDTEENMGDGAAEEEDEMPEDKKPDDGTQKGLGGGDSFKKDLSDDSVEKGGTDGDDPADSPIERLQKRAERLEKRITARVGK